MAGDVGSWACGFWGTDCISELHSQPIHLSLNCSLRAKIKVVQIRELFMRWFVSVCPQICLVNSTQSCVKPHFSNEGFFSVVYNCTIMLNIEIRFQNSLNELCSLLFPLQTNIILKQQKQEQKCDHRTSYISHLGYLLGPIPHGRFCWAEQSVNAMLCMPAYRIQGTINYVMQMTGVWTWEGLCE